MDDRRSKDLKLESLAVKWKKQQGDLAAWIYTVRRLQHGSADRKQVATERGKQDGRQGPKHLGAASGLADVRANAGTKLACRPAGHSQAVRAWC